MILRILKEKLEVSGMPHLLAVILFSVIFLHQMIFKPHLVVRIIDHLLHKVNRCAPFYLVKNIPHCGSMAYFLTSMLLMVSLVFP